MRFAGRFMGSEGMRIGGVCMMWVEENRMGLEFW